MRQEELEKDRRTRLQSGQFAASEDMTESVAFAQLSVQQREERKRKEVNKEKMKNVLNPVLFAEDLDQNTSIAYALLTDNQRDAVYKQEVQKDHEEVGMQQKQPSKAY